MLEFEEFVDLNLLDSFSNEDLTSGGSAVLLGEDTKNDRLRVEVSSGENISGVLDRDDCSFKLVNGGSLKSRVKLDLLSF